MKRTIMFALMFIVVSVTMQAQSRFIAKVYSDSIVVGLTRVQLPDHPEAEWVQIMHEHATAKIYIGGEDVVILNGFGALENLDTTEKYIVQNTDVFYLISDVASVTVKYMWGE